LLREGDLVVIEGGDVGRCAIWRGIPESFYFQNAINRVRARTSASTRFLCYWLYNIKHAGFIDAMVSRITIAHLTAEKLARVPWPDVPSAEQRRIAAYLDASCAAIDAAMAAKRRQLETLDALALSVIHQAVTRGINAAVKLRQSGMEWLPEVPEHWQVRQIKRTCEIVRGKFTHRPRNDPAFYGGEYPFVQTGDITAVRKYIRTYSQTLNELGLSVSKTFPRGTLVMSIAANIGDVAILDFEACFPDSMVGLIPRHKTDLNFLYYMMRAMKGIMLRSAVISTQLNLNNVRIGTNFAAFPPIKEQKTIGEYLDAKEQEALAVKETLDQQIATLTAYRKSLIHECVTGQRRMWCAASCPQRPDN
jgi:type I restriction enzyme S subunit